MQGQDAKNVQQRELIGAKVKDSTGASPCKKKSPTKPILGVNTWSKESEHVKKLPLRELRGTKFDSKTGDDSTIA